MKGLSEMSRHREAEWKALRSAAFRRKIGKLGLKTGTYASIAAQRRGE